jgi:DNA-binding NarL/FixJ family response regulator
MTLTRVLLADDHAPTRAQIRELLELEPDFEVCGEAADAAGAIAAALSELPDICLLDIRMPGSGVAAAWEITSRMPATRVVMLTVSRDDGDLFAALRAGASGYLLKDIDPARLAAELRVVMSGEVALPAGLVTRLAAEFRDRSPKRRQIIAGPELPPLTSREWEVLELLRNGSSTGEIASVLSVSRATVRSHVAGILHKLRVPDRESAVRLLDAANADPAEVEAHRIRRRRWLRYTARTS